MRPTRIVVALIVGLVGLVWLGQGLGLIAGSAMTGSGFWAAAGILLIVAALVITAIEYRASHPG
jgi:hypothetical protein